MQKITLKPSVKELLYKSDEVNTHYDVFSYSGTNSHEKMLGSLYVVGHIKYDEQEDLGYIVSLVASLAKREYYSENSLKLQNPKITFESTLKKLNEVLDDFFKNKILALNIGVMAIAGNQIFISKLGKFKVGLVRNGENIDVLNNVALFQKSPEHEQQFSNVISGQLYSGDVLFAYYPAKSITSRERMLLSLLAKEPNQFSEKIDTLAGNVNTFSCCGMLVSLEEIKEIPIEVSLPQVTLASSQDDQHEIEETNMQKTRVISAEISVAKKNNFIDTISATFGKIRNLNRMPTHSRFRGFVALAGLILVPIFIFLAVKAIREPNEAEIAYAEGVDNLNLAKTRIAQNETTEARDITYGILANIYQFGDDKNISGLKQDVEILINNIDKVIGAEPELISDLSSDKDAISEKRVLAFANNRPKILFNNSEILKVDDKQVNLKDPASAKDAYIYDGNLYVLSGGEIYKYANVITGGISRADWGTVGQDIISIAVDGNIFGLTADGKIRVFFRGKQKGELLLDIPVTNDSKIYTNSDGQYIYVFDKNLNKLFAVNKSDGKLAFSYKFEKAGKIKDIAVDDGGIWILSDDLRLWKIDITEARQ